jgi:hypothetical protein
MDEVAPGFDTLGRLCALVLGHEKRPISFDADFAAHGLALAERHCVVPLLAAGLAVMGKEGLLSAGWSELLRRKTLSGLRDMVRMEAELGRIAACLSAVGVDFLLLKGPATARQAYPVPDLRGYDDLDLWVRSCDLEAAVHALSKTAYRLWRPMDARAFSCALRAGIEIALTQRDRRRLVELAHGDLALASSRKAAREMVAGAASLEIAGVAVRAPKPVHALLFACRHGAHHCWDRLVWVTDVAGLWMRLSPAEHEETYATARRWRMETMLGLGLRLASEWLCLSLDGRAAELASLPRVLELARRAGLEKIRSDSPRAPMLARLRFERDAQDSTCQRWRTMAEWIFTPTLGDIEAVPLPAALSPLYALIRPLRLLRHPWLRDWRKLAGRGVNAE